MRVRTIDLKKFAPCQPGGCVYQSARISSFVPAGSVLLLDDCDRPRAINRQMNNNPV